ncbi:MAG: hypothetical protein KatS3mg105_3927 [Gemmatales bacterium]|nr:MAG: hypothetical protein KatS3mg105_3927 [Gemmatales bacterium]
MTDIPHQEDETTRKVKLAAETLLQLAHKKQRSAAWGQVSLRLFWENGNLKLVEISDTTTIKDLNKK